MHCNGGSYVLAIDHMYKRATVIILYTLSVLAYSTYMYLYPLYGFRIQALGISGLHIQRLRGISGELHLNITGYSRNL